MITHNETAEKFGRSLAVQAFTGSVELTDQAAAAAIVALSMALTDDISKQKALRKEAASEYKRARDLLVA